LIETDQHRTASSAQIALDPTWQRIAVLGSVRWHSTEHVTNRYTVVPVGTAALLENDNAGAAAFPQVAADAAGNAWRDLEIVDGTRDNISGFARYAAGSGWGAQR